MRQTSPLIFQVIPTLQLGGAERFVIELSDRLSDRGFRVKLLVLFDRGPLWDEVRSRNISWSQIVSSHASSRLDVMRSLQKRFFCEEDLRRPAIVHTHLFGSDFWTAVAVETRMLFGHRDHTHPSLISTVHNIDHEDGTLRRLARRWAMRRFDHVVGVSEDAMHYAVSDLGVSSDRASWIDGMNVLSSRSGVVSRFHETPRFLSIGRLVEQKGFATALKALSKITLPWEYTIVGEGELERSLKELAESLGIASRVHFIGAQSDIRPHLESADVLLMPSKWEGLGMVALEAISYGVPVLASDVPALKTVLPDSQRIPVGDIDAWTARIQQSLERPGDLLEGIRGLQKETLSRFDPDRITDAYADLYSTMLKQ